MIVFPSWIGFVEYESVYTQRSQSSVSVLAGARAGGARWEPRLLYAKGYQLSTQDSEGNMADVLQGLVVGQAVVWHEAHHGQAFHDTSNQIMFLRGNDIYLPRDLQRRHTKLTDIL
jgi:hypothetical protein